MDSYNEGNEDIYADVFDCNDDIEVKCINKIKTKLYNEGYSDGRLQGIKDLVYQRVKVGFQSGIEVGIICGSLYSECSIFCHRFNYVKNSTMDVLLDNIRRILLEELPHEVDTSKLLPELRTHIHDLEAIIEREDGQLVQKYSDFIDRLKLVEARFGPTTSTVAGCCTGTGACK